MISYSSSSSGSFTVADFFRMFKLSVKLSFFSSSESFDLFSFKTEVLNFVNLFLSSLWIYLGITGDLSLWGGPVFSLPIAVLGLA
jgi:hypothetical protein